MKKIEYYINLLFYSMFCFSQFGTRIFNYCIANPLDAFFSKFVPKSYHPQGIKHPESRKVWNDISDKFFASRGTSFVLMINTFVLSLAVFYATNRLTGLKDNTIWIISTILALSWEYTTYILTDKNNKYKFYFREFDKRTPRWKRACTIGGFLLSLETISLPFIALYITDRI